MSKIILEYNGKNYHLSKRDIPNLNGSGKIIIERKNGLQKQLTDGNFRNMFCYQDNNGSYINGVHIEELIKKLEMKNK